MHTQTSTVPRVELAERTILSSFKFKDLSSLVSTPVKFLKSSFLGSSNSIDDSPDHQGPGAIPRIRGNITSARQPISMASMCYGTHVFIFTICRDGRVRIWNLLSRELVTNFSLHIQSANFRLGNSTTLDIPSTSNLDKSLLPATPVVAMQIFDESFLEHDEMGQVAETLCFKIMCHLPQTTTGTLAEFIIISAAVDANGHIHSTEAIDINPTLDDGQEALVDFTIQRGRHSVDNLADADADGGMPSNARGQDDEDDQDESQWLTLWTLWNRSSSVVIRYCQWRVPTGPAELLPQKDDHVAWHDPSKVTGKRWITVISRPNADAAMPTLKSFATSQSDTSSFAELFLGHFFEPGRFSLTSIATALAIYTGSDPDSISYESLTYSMLQSAVLSTVGADIESLFSEQNPADYFSTYENALYEAYRAFAAILLRVSHFEATPCSITLHSATNTIITVQRGPTIGILRAADSFEILNSATSSRSTNSQTISKSLPILVAPNSLFDGPLSSIQDKSLRHDLIRFMRLAEFITFNVFPDLEVATIEDEILSSHLDISIEDYAADVYSRTFSPDAGNIDHLLVDVGVQVKAIGNFHAVLDSLLDALRQTSDDQDIQDAQLRSGNSSTTAFVHALIASATSQIVSARLDTAKQSVFALLLIKSLNLHDADRFSISGPTLLEYIDVYRSYAKLAWITKQQISSSSPFTSSHRSAPINHTAPADSIHAQFSNIQLSADPTTIEDTTLIQYLLQHHYILDMMVHIRDPTNEYDQTESTDIASFIGHASRVLLHKLGFCAGSRHALANSTVILAKKLLAYGHVGIVSELCETHARPTAALQYLRARVWLEMLEWSKAATCFDSAIGGDLAQSDLSTVVSPELLENHCIGYYRHVSDLFLERNVLDHAVHFAQFALDLIPHEEHQLHANLIGSINKTIFKSYIEMADFDGAYQVILSLKDLEFRRDCVRIMINALCDQNDLFSLCAKFHFDPDMSDEVERTLEFKARTSELSLSPHVPNYHRICYAYYMYRENYQCAARSMYVLSHKLLTLPLPSIMRKEERAHAAAQIVAEQTQSLMTALNTLSLLSPSEAWISVPTGLADLSFFVVRAGAAGLGTIGSNRGYDPADDDDDDTLDDEGETNANGSKAINTHRHTTGTRYQPVRIVEISDIRKQYHLALAKLQLQHRFSEVMQTTAFLDAGDAYSMFCQAGLYDEALSFAAIFELDLARVFTAIVDHAYGASLQITAEFASKNFAELPHVLHSNEDDDDDRAGPISEIATKTGLGQGSKWMRLKLLLDRYDGVANGYRLHLVVIDAMLSRNRFETVPAWLVAPFE
eukprot:jgi/Hompol1/4021/HPOL_003437-RA